MIAFRRIYPVFEKECKDIIKNKSIIFITFIFPAFAFVFKSIMKDSELASVLPTFITMHIVMIPIINMANIIAEEKEKNTLRVLIMSNVKPMEYLIGIGLSVFLLTMLTTLMFLGVLSLNASEIYKFIFTALCGVLCSIILGAVIGVIVKNHLSVGTIASPTSMIIGMLPMFASFNKSIYSVSKYLYSQAIVDIIKDINKEFSVDKFLVVLINFIIFAIIFSIIYRRKKLVD